MVVYADNIHCFGCGFHRNDYDECLALLRAAGAKGTGKGTVRKARPAPPPTLGYARMYHRFLHESRTQRLDWFYKRGLTDESIDMALLGHDGGRFTIPVFDATGKLVTIRFRNDDQYGEWAKYSGWPGVNQTYLYGANWIDRTDISFVVLTEGELDALALQQIGIPAVSATNGASQTHEVPGMVSDLWPHVRSLVVATDQDSAGATAAVATAQAASRLGFEVWRWEWWCCKDVTELLLITGGELAVLWQRWDGEKFVRSSPPEDLPEVWRGKTARSL